MRTTVLLAGLSILALAEASEGFKERMLKRYCTSNRTLYVDYSLRMGKALLNNETYDSIGEHCTHFLDCTAQYSPASECLQ